MKLRELQPILDRDPFRPFGVRLSNGVSYMFLEPRNLGAPQKIRDTLFWFGTREWALIDVENITEVFEIEKESK
jgi:hypothetical protein